MCSKARLALLLAIMATVSCTSYRKVQRIRSGELAMELSVAEEESVEEPVAEETAEEIPENQ